MLCHSPPFALEEVLFDVVSASLTNLEEVVFLHRPDREGGFLKKLLSGFDGVLVSDFYAAYDSVDCQQQKCLVHLMRDMNQDLLSSHSLALWRTRSRMKNSTCICGGGLRPARAG